MSNFLSHLDDETREKYLKTKSAQSMNASPAITMSGPDPRYFPPFEIAKELEKIKKPCETGDLQFVRLLVEDEKYHPCPDYLSKALVSAIQSKQLPIVQYLLDRHAAIDRQVMSSTAQAKSLPIFELLAHTGCNFNAPTFGGGTLLTAVIPDEMLVEWLLLRGADPNLGPPKFNTSPEAIPTTGSGACLNATAGLASPRLFHLLLRHGAKLDNSRPMHQAVRRGGDSIPMLTYLLNLGVDINSLAEPNDQFSIGTPLESVIRHGARAGSVEIARFLLERGAGPHPDGRPGIDAFEEPFRSQLQKIAEQYQLRLEGRSDDRRSGASSATLPGS